MPPVGAPPRRHDGRLGPVRRGVREKSGCGWGGVLKDQIGMLIREGQSVLGVGYPPLLSVSYCQPHPKNIDSSARRVYEGFGEGFLESKKSKKSGVSEYGEGLASEMGETVAAGTWPR